eukprot:TRINITY_DN6143_c0_g3_i2.p1 TRINITY_DN6143_c0_g3~~TRINITY_DN6143_c0_g3_i2.p1  ORF type:complete len:126 (-),score=22.45 TRINITY_DN6143_c0_g3_i2:482-859(-)
MNNRIHNYEEMKSGKGIYCRCCGDVKLYTNPSLNNIPFYTVLVLFTFFFCFSFVQTNKREVFNSNTNNISNLPNSSDTQQTKNETFNQVRPMVRQSTIRTSSNYNKYHDQSGCILNYVPTNKSKK